MSSAERCQLKTDIWNISVLMLLSFASRNYHFQNSNYLDNRHVKRLRDSVGCAYLVIEYVVVLLKRDKPTHALLISYA